MMKKLLSVGNEYLMNERSSTAGTAFTPEGRITSRSTILDLMDCTLWIHAM
jgi:hypothetical protein